MDRWVFSFITGAVLSLTWPALPPPVVLPIICFLAVIFLCLFHMHMASGVLFGTLWMASVGHWTLNWQLPLSQISDIRQISGVVTNLVTKEDDLRLVIDADTLYSSGKKITSLVGWKFKLNWKTPTWRVKQGQRIKVSVRLKPAYGLGNQGAFNYQTWLLSQNIVATGYIVDKPATLLDPQSGVRQALYDSLMDIELRHPQWIAALSLGERSGIDAKQWHLIQSTGIAHLIAISGLHLSSVVVVSAFVLAMLFRGVARFVAVPQSINLTSVICIGSLSVCLVYAWIAGFAIPVLRAWFMLAVMSFLILVRHKWRVSSFFMFCVFLFIVVFPRSLFSASFWLSFGAVFSLCFILWRWPGKPEATSAINKWKVLVRLQLLLCVLMLPLVGWQFSYTSIISPLVNLVAVPLVTLLVVPLCLIGVVCLMIKLLPVAAVIFQFVDRCLGYGLDLLTYSSKWDFSSQHFQSMPLLVWLFLFLAILVLCMAPVKSSQSPFCDTNIAVYHLFDLCKTALLGNRCAGCRSGNLCVVN